MINLRKLLISGTLFTLASTSVLAAVNAGTIFEGNNNITMSPNGNGYTTDYMEQTYEWYPEGTTVSSGLTSSLNPGTGQHLYTSKDRRTGKLPISKWEVFYEDHTCIHGKGGDKDNYLGFIYGTEYKQEYCFTRLYSGWFGYCADCGEIATTQLHYMSKETAESLDYIDLDKHYFYICPFNLNLEQGTPYGHYCKSVSNNRYYIKYNANTASTYGGWMSNTVHTWDNVKEFEGQPITPDTKLRKNTYTLIGYQFMGWNTKPDGSGTHYSDGQTVTNLTSTNGEVVNLYAQWAKTTSSLNMNPNGGTINGSSNIYSISNTYDTVYNIPNPTPPYGTTIKFNTNGGNAIADIKQTKTFLSWSNVGTLNGILDNGKYTFKGPEGGTDTVIASYKNNAVTLPTPTKSGSQFAGWYSSGTFNAESFIGMGGTIYTPSGITGSEVTLYANWADLKLTATDDYDSFGGSGAVDLSWYQGGSDTKTYKVYQKQEGESSFTEIGSADDPDSNITVPNKTFNYSGNSNQTYTVPTTGTYTISAYGAQGGNSGSYVGGKGGTVTGTFYLQEGEVLTYTVGGQNGFNGGGTASTFGCGGGYTIVSSNLKGTLLIAGGGGGATSQENGRAGGLTENLVTGNNGANGYAGGGGGYQGGAAGEHIVHNHTDDCYHHESTEYTAFTYNSSDALTSTSSWWTNYVNGGTPGSKGGPAGSYSGSGYAHTIRPNGGGAHGGGEDESIDYVQYNGYIGAYYNNSWGLTTPTGSTTYIPTNGNTNVNIGISTSISGHMCTVYYNKNNSYIRVYNQNGTVIYSSNLIAANEYRHEHDHSGESIDDTIETKVHITNSNGISGLVREYMADHGYEYDGEWGGCASMDKIYGTMSVPIPDGTTSIYVQLLFYIPDGDAWVGSSINKIEFTGGQTSTVICGYTDGQVISSKASYGGSNYINTTYASNYSENSGQVSGNGYITLVGNSVGFNTATKLDNVKATDYAAPNKVDDTQLDAIAAGKVRVSWDKPDDNGTPYYHKVDSYIINKGTLTYSLTSNETKNTLTSGIRGYKYKVSNSKETNAASWSETSNQSVDITQTEKIQYLCLAAIDVAGNIGPVTHVEISNVLGGSIDPPEASLMWDVHTVKINTIIAENVYKKSGTNNTYYVLADGKTPFNLNYDSYIDGAATNDYQINGVNYKINTGSKNQLFSSYLPYNIPVGGEITYENPDTSISSPVIFNDGNYTIAKRVDASKKVNISKYFTVDSSYSGSTITVTPQAYAIDNLTSNTKYSDATDDANNKIIIIADAEKPYFTGTDKLNQLQGKIIDIADGTININLTAKDSLSGLKDFKVVVKNTDNHCEETFISTNGSIAMDITVEDPVFRGDWTITLQATDNVGNYYEEKYSTREFSLDASIQNPKIPGSLEFKTGDIAVLDIDTTGYVEKIVITFPDELVDLNPDLDKVYEYEYPDYIKDEIYYFNIPLYTPENIGYTIKVSAYKDGEVLNAYPRLNVISIEGTILDDFKTTID